MTKPGVRAIMTVASLLFAARARPETPPAAPPAPTAASDRAARSPAPVPRADVVDIGDDARRRITHEQAPPPSDREALRHDLRALRHERSDDRGPPRLEDRRALREDKREARADRRHGSR